MYIAICGPSGAGKDTAAELFVSQRGYAHVSGGDVLREMLTSLGLEPKKSALGPFGEFIRNHYGVQPLFERVLAKAQGKKGVVISGIRSPDEANLIKKYGGLVVYIDANATTRYERIIARSRGHDITTREQFDALDSSESAGVTGTEQNLQVIKSMADVVILNDGTTADLARQIDRLSI